jgi:hypothetical protein
MKKKLTGGSAIIRAATLIIAFAPCSGYSHEEPVHQQITLSAFRSSGGTSAFLSEVLGAASGPFTDGPTLTTRPSDYPASRRDSPLGWLGWGAYMEDDDDPSVLGIHFLRSSCHFYRVLSTTKWLTDSTEYPLPKDRSDSFTWATSPALQGPEWNGTFAGPNTQTWQNARGKQFDALTLPGKLDRDAALALSLYALGHVLHLNQDLSSPDHVRNDEHLPWPAGKHWIEEYGLKKYLEESKKAGTLGQTFPLRARGWQSWRMAGFQKLKDFWDRGLYTGQNSSALNDDRAATWPPQSPPTTKQLGLAEFSNGNFLGEDATYGDLLTPATTEYTLHYFPLPSLWTSTAFRVLAASPVGAAPVTFRNGLVGNRLYNYKYTDGYKVHKHSALTHAGANAGKTVALTKLKGLITIHDDNVLQEYHSILIPKAIEYSAGILDYFFRGKLDVTVAPGSGVFQLHIVNSSGQMLSGGAFTLYQDDNSGNRTAVTLNLAWGGNSTLPDGGALDGTFSATFASGTKLMLVYKGTIGIDGATPPASLDPADAGIAIAAQSFSISSHCVDFSGFSWADGYTFGSANPPTYSLNGASIAFDCESGPFLSSYVGDGAGAIRYTGDGCSCRATIHVTARVDPPLGTGANGGGFQLLQDGVTVAQFDLSPRSKGVGTYLLDFSILPGTDSLIEIKGIYSMMVFNQGTGQPELKWFYDVADTPSSNFSPHGRLAWDAAFTCLDE